MPNAGSSGHSSEVSTYSLANVDMLKFPVLVSVPHAGRDYPSRLIDNLNVPASHLLRLEDRYVDRLAASAAAAGFPLIVARKPRAWLDLNRSPAEIDPEMVAGMDPSQTSHISRKVRGGLGILPRRLHDHEPYHVKIAHILAQMQSVFGGALLLDLHSMPSVFDQDRRQIGFVIGDRFGRSCDSRYAELAAVHFRRGGYHVQTNHPYSGGYILERHGKPARNVHALQLEVDRALYLDESLREPTDAAGPISELIRNCCVMLADQLSGRFQLEAAE